MNNKKSKGYPGKAYPKTQKEKDLMGERTSYGAKLEAIKKAMKTGQKFYLHTYLGQKGVEGIDHDGTWAVTGSGLEQRSWAICSTEINRWYSELYPLNKPGLKPGASLPTTAREAKIMVELVKMAKAKRALFDLSVTVFDVDLLPTTFRRPDGTTFISTAAHIHFCDDVKKDKDGDVNEEKTVIYID